MILPTWPIGVAVLVFFVSQLPAQELPDIRKTPFDLQIPVAAPDPPGPGRRVKLTAPEYAGTQVFHTLYLPTDWKSDATYPVLVEYAGNGPYKNKYGDSCSGKVEDCKLGFGISGGKGFLWVCMPFISKDGKQNQRQWWGDVNATAEYCKTNLRRICREFGGDPQRMILVGFSRGSIACNYIGLHDEDIAKLWCGFVCHSHYDGVRRWPYSDSDVASAVKRLQRLKGRPQFISHEVSTSETEAFLTAQERPPGDFTFAPLPYRNHTDTWVLRPIKERDTLRKWVAKVIQDTDQK